MKLHSILLALVAVAVLGGGGWAWVSKHGCPILPSSRASASAGSAKGSFDPAMAGCRFSCSTREAFDERDVIAQPGARVGQLTQCPVSGVVFTVDEDRPRAVVAEREYVLCCDQCKTRFERAPARFVRL